MKILKTKLPQDKSVELYVNIVFSVDIAKQNTPFVAFARMPSIQLTWADLEGACGACAPLKFAKHMLYNVN
jgi:hypothetical protein